MTWLDTAETTAKSLRKVSAFTGPMYLEPGLKPPTNSWVAGTVFGNNPIWTLTGLAIKPNQDSLGVHLVRPEVWGDKAMIGAYKDEYAIKVKFEGSPNRSLAYYDEALADFTYRTAAGDLVAEVSVAQGWPYVEITAHRPASISRVGGTFTRLTYANKNIYLLTEADNTAYLISTPTAATITGSNLSVQASDAPLFITALPNTTTDTRDAMVDGMQRLIKVDVQYSVDNTSHIAYTEINYPTVSNQPTVLGYLPHQVPRLSGTPIGTFNTVLGPVALYKSNAVTFNTTLYDTTQYALDLTNVNDTHKGELRNQVKVDVNTLTFPGDTYFGGKALYRATNLMVLAEQLGLTAEAESIKTKLKDQLALWFDPARTTQAEKTFVFDPTLVGVVGLVAGFGSDSSFNDHHFHYGYLLYAAGVLAQREPALVDKYRAIADVLLADIAAPTATSTTIVRRSFDAYAGHSWANGLGGGVDGNDQESTAEAINAWAGASLWAKASGNTEALNQALWMASLEAATAKVYWFNPHTLPGFNKPHISMVFAGKSDYGTWFSADRSDVTGIQIIPMSAPVAAHLRDLGPDRIKELFKSILIENPRISGRSHLIDWNIMFLSLADKDGALAVYWSLEDSDIDNGNTRSHMLATILSGVGVQEPEDPEDPEIPDEPVGTHYKNGDSIPAHFSTAIDAGTTRTVTFRVASGAADGISGLVSVEIGGQKVAEIAVANTGGWDKFIDVKGNFPDLHGEYDGVVKFTSGQPNEFATIESLTLDSANSKVTLGDTEPEDPDEPDDPDLPEEPQPLRVVLQFNPDGSVTWSAA